jgi:hypothetical protein
VIKQQQKHRQQRPLNQVHVKRVNTGNRQRCCGGFIMTEIRPNLDQKVPNPPHLVISGKIAASLPESVRNELAGMPEDKQEEFLRAFQRRSASLVMAYLSSLIYCHYGLLGRWAMTGWMWLSLFVASTLGFIWWLIDLVRIPEMVREHNHRIAADILRQLNPPSDPAPLAGA